MCPAIELLTLSVMNSESINALYVCHLSTKEPDFKMSLGPVPVTEMSVSPVSLNESVFELSILSVTAMETLNELSVCSVNSVIAKDTPSEQSFYAVPVHELNTESVALSVTTQKPAFQSLNPPVMSPETINASHVFRVGSVNAIETIYELSSCSVSVNEPGFELSASNPVYELSFRPVSVSRPIDDFVVFYASSLGAMDALSVSCVSVFTRSQSLPWSSGPSAPPRWSSTPVWWSSAPPRWSSTQVWWSSAPSAPPWWAPVQSAPP